MLHATTTLDVSILPPPKRALYKSLYKYLKDLYYYYYPKEIDPRSPATFLASNYNYLPNSLLNRREVKNCLTNLY